ncbi:MAG: BamA/TamA family outer membrane protein [Bacteroidota bacterium]
MRAFKLTYFKAISLLLLLYSCNATRNVPDGKQLLDKNVIKYTDEKLNNDEVNTIIRQQPNRKSFGIKLKLYTYNWIDSTKVLKARSRQYNKIIAKNKKRKAREKRINEKRIAKARAKGKEEYTQRIVPLKDTVNVRLSLREWIKYKRGEKPVIYDSIATNKSVDQLKKYLRKKGYYYGNVTAETVTDSKNPKKRSVTYTIYSGKPYYIDTVTVDCPNASVLGSYNNYLKKQLFDPLTGHKFDEDYLNAYRAKVAKYMRDDGLYGFSPSSINYIADTNKMKLGLTIIFSDRKVIEGDSAYTVPYANTYVENVYFHIIDTTWYPGSYELDMKARDLSLIDKETGYLRTFDTIFYNKIVYTAKERKSLAKRGIKTDKTTPNPLRFAYIYYNGRPKKVPGRLTASGEDSIRKIPMIRSDMLELQNYLENKNIYKEYYIDRSYNRLVQLDVFQTIKPVIKETGGNKLEVHYYLVPAKKQVFNIEQRFTNSNGFLGSAASINYSNKNLFRGSEKMTISFGGGFESQPPVFTEGQPESETQKAARSFNTFEIGPSIKFDLPGLFLIRRSTKLSKRHRPRTIVSAAYNYQKRNDFEREIFQLNYMWKFYMGKTQVVQVGFPAAAIKYVRIDPKPLFEQRLDASNDPFLKNAYSNQFVWENLKVMFEYNNKMSDKKKKYNFVYNTSLVSAGWILSQFNLKDTTETGQEKVFGVAYSRFLRFDNDAIFGYPINKKTSFHARAFAGIGVPRGNKTTSLPFDYSFFAGGANDNRGWRARALGPGSYQYYKDSLRTATQIGDVKLGLFGELRYSLSPTFKAAVFIDADNIWTYGNDKQRPGGQFSKNFYKEIALATGFGLRIDFTFLVVRLDLGFPITNPSLPLGQRWIFQDQTEEVTDYLKRPFRPTLQFGIGYPF